MLCIKCQEAEENKESGFCDNCEKKEEGRINGVLYLPALGLIVGFFTVLYNGFSIVSLIADTYQKQGMINSFSIILLALSVINLPVTVLACWFFFKKKVKARYMMISYYLYGLIFATFCTLYPALVLHVTLTQLAISMLARASISCLIWIPYFIFSSRINKVFVH